MSQSSMEAHSRSFFFHGPLKLAGGLSRKYYHNGRLQYLSGVKIWHILLLTCLAKNVEERRREKQRGKKGREKHHVMTPPLTLGRIGNSVSAMLPDTGCQGMSYNTHRLLYLA